MVVRGRIHNGVVELSEQSAFEEGQEVIVLPQYPQSSNAAAARPHSILDIPVVRLGAVVSPPYEHDLLGEMLEERR